MARARNIKPGFFLNDELAECEPLARLLFAGLWCIADREGRLEDRPKRIKAEVLPYDNCDVDQLLNQLTRHGFILRYETGGEPYIQIINFLKHQNPHIKEAASIIPPPPENISTLDEHHTSTVLEPEQNNSFPADSLKLIPDSLKPHTESIFSSEQSPDVTQPDRQEPFEDEDKEEPKYNEESMAYKAALYLRNRILTNNPRARVPSDTQEDKLMQKWAQEIDRLNRIGPPGGKQGYSWQEIRQLIDYSQDDEFWQGVILSAGNLREKCVQLENQMKRSNKPRGQPTMSKNVADALRLVEKYAQEEREAL